VYVVCDYYVGERSGTGSHSTANGAGFKPTGNECSADSGGALMQSRLGKGGIVLLRTKVNSAFHRPGYAKCKLSTSLSDWGYRSVHSPVSGGR